jgi:hypothetical protein
MRWKRTARRSCCKELWCTDEDKELQRLLERNLNLLPGDQISPGQNLRWLLVKREMPGVNPSSGENLWCIDFLLVDQDGVPTLVECKRQNDARTRREVVGQMLAYAASGRHYWTAPDFRSQAQNTAGDEPKLRENLKKLTGSETVPEEFFAAMERNPQRSKMRLHASINTGNSHRRPVGFRFYRGSSGSEARLQGRNGAFLAHSGRGSVLGSP